jgi:hypothetical protein
MSDHRSELAHRLISDVLMGRLSRRQVFKRATALGLGISTITALMTACADRDDDVDEVDDAELLRRHVGGDRSAFGELVHRHQDRLWAVALRTLGDPDDAADALQDAFVNAYRRAASFRAEPPNAEVCPGRH